MATTIPARLIELPGEDLDTQTLTEVASWIAIYDELATVLRSILNRSTQFEGGPDLAANLAWIEERLGLWRQRHAAMVGILVDTERHTVTYAGHSVPLTHRETDLLRFLLQHPHRPFSSRQLALSAWDNPRLSDAQVRTYVMRLRKRLLQLGLGNTIEVVKRKGYAVRPPGIGMDGA